MYLIGGIWPNSWREKAVSQGQVIAPQLELVEFDCDWSPRDRACCGCRRCTHLLLPRGKHNHCLQKAQLLPIQRRWLLQIDCSSCDRKPVSGGQQAQESSSLSEGSVLFWVSGSLLECGELLQAQAASLTSRQCVTVCESRLHC